MIKEMVLKRSGAPMLSSSGSSIIDSSGSGSSLSLRSLGKESRCCSRLEDIEHSIRTLLLPALGIEYSSVAEFLAGHLLTQHLGL